MTDQKTQMREGFEAQRKSGMSVDWFTWQIAWHDALFTVHDIAGDTLARQTAAIDKQEAAVTRDDVEQARDRILEQSKNSLFRSGVKICAGEILSPIEPCDKPPAGWTCSRTKGHEGPCAASLAAPSVERDERAERVAAFKGWFSTARIWNNAITQRAWLAACEWMQARAASTSANVAQYQTKLRNPILPECDVWINVSEEGARTAREKYSDVYAVRELFERSANVAQKELRSQMAYIAAYDPDESDGMSKDRLANRLRAIIERARMALRDVPSQPANVAQGAEAVTSLRRIAHELRTYNPAADEYKGEHIHKVWAREIEAILTAASNGESK